MLRDEEQRVVGALRPLAETRRDLVLGAPFRSPPSAPPPPGADRWAELADDAFFAAVEAAADEREARGAEAQLRARLERALRRAEQSLAKKRTLLEADAAAGEEAEALRRQGELLKTVVARLKPGAREARVHDYASGEEVVIPLDPAVPPRAALDQLFRRARKAE